MHQARVVSHNPQTITPQVVFEVFVFEVLGLHFLDTREKGHRAGFIDAKNVYFFLSSAEKGQGLIRVRTTKNTKKNMYY